MINPRQLRDLIIIPTLNSIDLNSPSAVELLMGTAMQESNLSAIHQFGGPALGLWQMEPDTHDDIWKNWLYHKVNLSSVIQKLMIPSKNVGTQMEGNLYYACAMARCLYRRVPEALPKANDIVGMATYWKKYYNTPLGAGTINQYISNWNKLAAFL